MLSNAEIEKIATEIVVEIHDNIKEDTGYEEHIIRDLLNMYGDQERIRESVFEKLETDFPLHCPKEGSFIAYKKARISVYRGDSVFFGIDWRVAYSDIIRNPCIVKLEIPETAKRTSAFGIKCRSNMAKVLEIKVYGNSGIQCTEAKSLCPFVANKIKPVVYRIGEMVYPDSFDDCRWIECGHGIHFFMNEEEAMSY